MADPFVAEIRIFAFSYQTPGWALCNGAILTVSQNQALFALLGNQYGGQVGVNFNLPDLQGRTPIHRSNIANQVIAQGTKDGAETVTLTAAQLPPHQHSFYANSSAATLASQDNAVYAAVGVDPSYPTQPALNMYGPSSGTPVTLAAGTVGNSGGSGPHANMQPSLVINFSIATLGLWPSRQ